MVSYRGRNKPASQKEANRAWNAHWSPPGADIPSAGRIGGVIGRMHHVVLDCPDPAALAAFYSALLGLPVTVPVTTTG